MTHKCVRSLCYNTYIIAEKKTQNEYIQGISWAALITWVFYTVTVPLAVCVRKYFLSKLDLYFQVSNENRIGFDLNLEHLHILTVAGYQTPSHLIITDLKLYKIFS